MSGMTADKKRRSALRPMPYRGFIVTMMGLAVVTALGGAWLRHREALDRLQMAEVHGHVVAIDGQCHVSRRGGSCRYFPSVVFHTPNGRRVQFRSHVGAAADYFAEGEGVPVLYDPHSDDPGETAYIRDYGMRISSFVWLIAAGFVATGVLVRILPENVRSDTPGDVVETASAPNQWRRHSTRRSQ